MTNDYAPQAFTLACEVFVEASVLHTAVGISVEEYQRYMDASFKAMISQGLSLVAVDTDTNKVIGCLIACDYLTQGQATTTVPKKLKPVNAILANLDNLYRKNQRLQAGDCMLVDMAVVTPDARKLGIYSELRKAAHRLGREAGFTRVVGELSSAATQRLCVDRLNHKVCAEIEYASFEYEGQTPFSSISTPKSILLTEGAL